MMHVSQPQQMRVSWHAVIRFCQRILNVPEIQGQFNSWALAKAHADAAGLTIEQITKMILTENVMIGLKYGRDRVSNEIFTAVINNGNVITVFEGGDYTKPKTRTKIRTKREARMNYAKHQRRRT
jgi:hypothetical protein